MIPGEFEDSSISRILHLVQGVGLLKREYNGSTKDIPV
jgi:hypothetical protein